MSFITRGFAGRSREPDSRLPPGQSLADGWPVLTAGPTPRIDRASWELTIDDETGEVHRWDWNALIGLGVEDITVDIHCVTHWSRLDMSWRGVSLDKLFAGVESGHDFVMAHSYGGYTTNLPVEDLLDGQAWIAIEADGEPLRADHGGPARLLVPHLYFWKSAKWIRGLTLMPGNDPGFWEQAGITTTGIPGANSATGKHSASSATGERTERGVQMRAIVVTEQNTGPDGLELVERPEPAPAINDAVVRVHAAGWVPDEIEWPSTWVDRAGHDKAPSIVGHELAGVVTGLGYGTTGVAVGQRVCGIADWHRDGTVAEYVAVEARNLAPIPDGVDFAAAASLPISGLTAWQGLFDHGQLQPGQRVLAHGAAGALGSTVVQLAHEFGAHVIGTGRAADREKVLGYGADEFVDLGSDELERIGEVDLVFDVIGGDVQQRSARLVKSGGRLVSVVGPVESPPPDGQAIDFVVEANRQQLSELLQRVQDGRLRTNIGTTAPLDDALAALNPAERRKGKTIITVAA